MGTARANYAHGLSRFVQAQTGDYDQALAEIKCGRKCSHKMCYIFPQIEDRRMADRGHRHR
jgi:uncharacterized protein (DUF1810 family)